MHKDLTGFAIGGWIENHQAAKEDPDVWFGI
jgi:hypothetical protein